MGNGNDENNRNIFISFLGRVRENHTTYIVFSIKDICVYDVVSASDSRHMSDQLIIVEKVTK